MPTTYKGGQKWSGAYAQGKKIRLAYKGGALFYGQQTELTNLLSNGSIESNVTGWSGTPTPTRLAKSPVHSENGSYTGQLTRRTSSTIYTQHTAITVTRNNLYYIRAKVYPVTANYGYQVQFRNSSTALTDFAITDIRNGDDNGWFLYDGIWTANATSLTLRLNFTGGYGTTTRTVKFDNVMVLDLTTAYGTTVPDVTALREIVSNAGGYWDGTITI